MEQYIFTDNSFIMAFHILEEIKHHWVVRDFEHNGISKRLVSEFYNYLIKEGVFYRKKLFGPGSYCVVKKKERLLEICREKFFNPERRMISFITQRNKKNILKSLKNKGIKFYLAKFSGVSPELKYVQDDRLYLFLLDSKQFKYESLYYMEKDLGMYRVKHDGDIFIFLPRFKKFLRHSSRKNGDYDIPSNFYSYLDMYALDNPRGKEQAWHMLQKLKEKGCSFVR